MAFAAFIAGGDDSVRTNELTTTFLDAAGPGLIRLRHTHSGGIRAP